MQKFIGYAVAGGILLVLADFAPGIATGTAGLILLGVAITHAPQLTAVSQFIGQATGGK